MRAGVAIGLTLCVGTAWAGHRVVEAPCVRDGSEQELKAERAKPESSGKRLCSAVLKEARAKLKDRVQEQAEQYYRGCDFDPTRPEVGGCRGNRIYSPPSAEKGGGTCNILDQEGVPKTFSGGQVESERDHNGQVCGDWPFFATSMDGRRCNIRPDYTRTTHFIEDAYNRGAWIQALNCYHQQVDQEVAEGRLKLTKASAKDVNGRAVEEDGPCGSLEEEYESAVSTSDGMAKEIGSRLARQENIKDIENCRGEEQASATDLGGHRQSACQLRASREALEAMFMQLSACEVFWRAGQSHQKFLGGTPGRDEVKEAARASINGIRSKDASLCTHRRILNEFYKPNFLRLFKRRADNVWNAGACAPLAEGGSP